MQTQTKRMRHKTLAIALLIGVPFVTATPCLADDNTSSKGKSKTVPSYVAAHYEKAKVRSVQSNKAMVRSGPSEKYYATSNLAKGAAVEVYMETSDGWSGIRPPAGSHDWIPSSVAYLLPGGKTAEIIQDKTPAWVGSDAADVSEFMWQLELVKSQQVQILGEEMQLTEDGSKQLWYRIAPPQGEFRWVKTSLLSDSPPIKSKDSGVQLANYVQDSSGTSSSGSAQRDGKIVWSDEKQSLEQVESQIRREQAEIQRKMEADGIRVNLDSPKVEVKSDTGKSSSKTVAKTVSNRRSEPESVVTESEPVDVSSSSSTPIQPIPMTKQSRRIAQMKASEHQIDGQRQWEAMQTADPKLRVKPVSSILGLFGLSVIEAERAPVSTSIARQYHTTPSQGNIGRIGPVGNSRLDRLPRPGQRPVMTLPEDGEDTLGYPMGSGTEGWNGMHDPAYGPMQQPPVQGESTFSRWLHSREPVFGSTQPNHNPSMAGTGMQPMLQGNAFGNPYATQPQTIGFVPETTAWHGLKNNMRAGAQPYADAPAMNNYDSDAEPEQFQTPEIQAALVHLTREVAGPTEEWNFANLRNQAATWVENGATAMVRGEARLLMDRIDRFESLRQRTLGLAQDASMIAQQTMNNAAVAAMRQAGNVAPASAINANTNGSGVSNAVATNTTSEGDASGWLVQVHTTIKGQPEFALTDDAGKVITYVQSSPAINLRRYLQQPVTVYGMRGYIPNLAAKQILAERVVRMR